MQGSIASRNRVRAIDRAMPIISDIATCFPRQKDSSRNDHMSTLVSKLAPGRGGHSCKSQKGPSLGGSTYAGMIYKIWVYNAQSSILFIYKFVILKLIPKTAGVEECEDLLF